MSLKKFFQITSYWTLLVWRMFQGPFSLWLVTSVSRTKWPGVKMQDPVTVQMLFLWPFYLCNSNLPQSQTYRPQLGSWIQTVLLIFFWDVSAVGTWKRAQKCCMPTEDEGLLCQAPLQLLGCAPNADMHGRWHATTKVARWGGQTAVPPVLGHTLMYGTKADNV